MITVEIGEKDYYLPEGWHEVKLDQYEDILKMSSILNEYKSKSLFTMEIFAILLRAPLNQIMKLNKEAFEVLTTKCDWTQDPIKTKKVKNITIEGEKWVAIENMNKLSMGDVVSLELMINESAQEQLLLNILPILIRKVKKVMRDGKEIEVPADFDSDNYEETKMLFKKHLNVEDVIWLKDFFLDGVSQSSITMKASSANQKKSQKKKMTTPKQTDQMSQ